MRAPLFARKVGRSIDLVLLLLLLLPVRALAAPTQALITGTMYKPGGAVCGGCSLTVRTPYTQSVDGGSFPGGSQSSWKTDADGELPADAYSWQGLWVEITQQYADPCTVQIPASSSVTLATLNSSCASPPLGGSNADMTAVWTCSSGDCSDLVAGGGDTFDATAADSTAPCKDGTSTPATCSVGECFFDTDATAGGNLYLCTSTDTWTLSSGGGGSGDVTAVGNCATGACFDGTSGTTLTGSGASTVLQGTGSLFFNLDTNADSSADGFVVANNSTGTGGTKLFEINESNNAYLYNNMALWFREATANGTDAIIVSGPSSLASPFSIALPAETGTVCTTGSVCTGYAASSSDVTKVGDCASGACFDGTTGSTLTGASGTSLVVNTDNNIYLSFDTDNNATSTGVVIGSNASGASATPYVVVSDAATPNVTLRNATRLRFNDTSDDTNYVELVGPSGISSNFTFTLPSDDGTSNQFLQTNGSGVLTWATPSGSGNVSNTGTPANNQIAVWTDATTIEGDPKLTLSGSSLTLGDSAVDAGFTLATGLTGGTDPQIDFTNGQVDCANCRFTLTGGTKVIPDAGGGGVATRVPYWSDTDTLTDEAAFAYDSSTNTLTVTNVTGNASTASTASDLSNAGIDAVLPDIDGFGLSINTGTTPDELQLAPGEVTGPQVWGDGSGTMSWTFNTGITDPIIDFYATGVVDVTGTLQMNTVPVVTETGSQTLTNKTLTTPTIASFTNATHNHTNAAGGGTLTLAGSAFPNQGTTTTVLHGNAAGNPSWGAIVSADVTDGTLTASDLGTDSVSADELNATGVEAELEAVIDHNDLQGLTTGDPHTQYALLAGRSGGQTLIGGTASGNDLTLQSTSNATRGSIFFGSEWEWLDEIPDAADGTVYSGGTWGPTLSIAGAAGTPSYAFGLDLNPAMNLNDAAGIVVPVMGAIRGRGTYTRSGAATYVPSFYMLLADPTFTSATDGVGPIAAAIVYDGGTSSYTSTGSTTTTGGYRRTIYSNPLMRTNGGASTRMDVTDIYALYFTPRVYETTGTLNLTTLGGVKIVNVDVNATTPQITTQVGVDIDALSGATTNIGIRNADTTVYSPGAAQTLNVVGSSITPSATFIMVTASGATGTLTSNPQIADGVDGQIIHIIYTNGATGSFTFADGNGLQLAGAMLMDQNNSITLMYSSTIGDWIEIARSLN